MSTPTLRTAVAGRAEFIPCMATSISMIRLRQALMG